MTERTPGKLQDAIYWIGVNALRLRDDAQLLHRAYRFPSAIFLSVSCVEECVKYSVLWRSASIGSIENQDLRRHDEKFRRAFLFILHDLMIAGRDYYLSDPARTRKLAQKAGMNGDELLRVMRGIPDDIEHEKMIDVFLDSESMELMKSEPLKEFMDTSGLGTIRRLALYADLADDGAQLHLSHPMFLGDEMSRSMLKLANKASNFIRGTSERLAAYENRKVPFMGCAKV